MNEKAVLDLIADMKREAKTGEARIRAEQLAIAVMTQDIRPLKMADNLAYWLNKFGGNIHAA